MYTLGAIVNTTFLHKIQKIKKAIDAQCVYGFVRQQKNVSNQVMTSNSKTLLWRVEATKDCI